VTKVYEFIETTPTSENYLRGIVLFGRNSASYKFALAKALIDLARRGHEAVSLDELAKPFSAHLCAHLREAPKQAISRSGEFLEACRRFVDGDLDHEALWGTTARLGFVNVIDAFHNVAGGEVPMRFFVDERRTTTRGIRLTDDLLALAADHGDQALCEVEARWSLVETAWELGIASALIEYDAATGLLLPSSVRRQNLASARDTLNGYQKGRCFYCYRAVGTTPESTEGADVDHFIPHVLMRRGQISGLDQMWNLVLACIECNRDGKSDRLPSDHYVERLARRNDYFIESNLPIKETLILQTGATRSEREQFLRRQWDSARKFGIARWETPALADPAF